MSFKAAVEAVGEPFSSAYRSGKQALKGEHREQIECLDTRRLTGSVDLDGVLQDDVVHKSANRWDYGIGFRLASAAKEFAIWVEVHPATTGEVKIVLKKLEWLKNWLQSAGELKSLSVKSDQLKVYHWLSTSSGTAILKNSPQARQLLEAGLDLPRRKLNIP